MADLWVFSFDVHPPFLRVDHLVKQCAIIQLIKDVTTYKRVPLTYLHLKPARGGWLTFFIGFVYVEFFAINGCRSKIYLAACGHAQDYYLPSKRLDAYPN